MAILPNKPSLPLAIVTRTSLPCNLLKINITQKYILLSYGVIACVMLEKIVNNAVIVLIKLMLISYLFWYRYEKVRKVKAKQ